NPPPPPPTPKKFSIKENFFNWKGRLNRKAYFVRAFPLGLILLIVLQVLLELDKIPYQQLSSGTEFLIWLLLASIFPLSTSIYMNAIRRLHDLNKSGWFILLAWVPIVNFIFGLFLMFKKGTSGPNRFGADPLAENFS
ncbi:MAG: DUF805 domain-containing protein, partial [Selenomonadaceae bacterium]|nr:DUF805 domain-containing protein [Selenomonadaceae bacterium]